MATLSSTGGSATVPLAYTIAQVAPVPAGNVIVAPGSNVAMTYIQLPGGVDGAQVEIINLSSSGARVYVTGSVQIAGPAGAASTTTTGYIETTDVAAAVTLRYCPSDTYWVVVASSGTWTYV